MIPYTLSSIKLFSKVFHRIITVTPSNMGYLSLNDLNDILVVLYTS